MNIIDNRTSANKAQVQGGWNNTHQYIALHYLGVSNADNPNLYGGGYGGHYYIAIDGRVYWSADHNAVLWHVGTGGCYSKRYPNGWDVTNYNCIGIEMGCIQDADGTWRFTEATQQSAVELVKYLMKTLNISASHVLRHGDITTKICPQPWITYGGKKTNWTWETFKNKISNITNNSNNGGATYMFTCEQVKIGSNNNHVLLLQELLKANGYYTGALDKAFGSGTDAAVKKYQKDKGLVVDGICGPATWKSLIKL